MKKKPMRIEVVDAGPGDDETRQLLEDLIMEAIMRKHHELVDGGIMTCCEFRAKVDAMSDQEFDDFFGIDFVVGAGDPK